MYARGHIGLGLITTAPLLYFISKTQSVSLIIGTLLLVGTVSPLPDIDLKIPLLKHRGMTHTVWYAIGVGVLFAIATYTTNLSVFQSTVLTSGFYFVFGFSLVGSHILGDVITPMGISPFQPFSTQKYSLGVVKSANRYVNTALFIVGVFVVISAMYLPFY
jgi:inner membrane protein